MWDGWTAWSECSRTCGEGVQTHMRSCLFGEQGEQGCLGDAFESRSCTVKVCPFWIQWSQWSECSASCDGGSKTRFRQCRNGPAGEGNCDGSDVETVACNTQDCVSWSQWTAYSACSVSCGVGSKTRQRFCVNGEQGDAGCLGAVTHQIGCYERDCPYLSHWSAFSACSVSCGGGVMSRNRECMNVNNNDDPICMDLNELAPCNTEV